jgi:hypothetical protein
MKEHPLKITVLPVDLVARTHLKQKRTKVGSNIHVTELS